MMRNKIKNIFLKTTENAADLDTDGLFAFWAYDFRWYPTTKTQPAIYTFREDSATEKVPQASADQSVHSIAPNKKIKLLPFS